MSRRDLELRAKKDLEASGYLVERAVSKAIFTPKGFVARSFDFFNCFDLIAVKENEIRFIQVPSSDEAKGDNRTLRAHKKKINDNWPIDGPEIWHYYKIKGRWYPQKYQRQEGKWLPFAETTDYTSHESITGDLRGMKGNEGIITPKGGKK